MVINETLKNIYEEYKDLKEKKNQIQNKPSKTKDDIEKLEIIEELIKELLDKLNDEYQRQTKNNFYNNSTKNIPSGLASQLNNNNYKSANWLYLQNEEQENKKEQLKKEILNVLYNERGKKQFIKYKDKKYYIPIRCKSYFLYLLRELEKNNNETDKSATEKRVSRPVDRNGISVGLDKFLFDYMNGYNISKQREILKEEINKEENMADNYDSPLNQQIQLIDISRKKVEKPARKPLIGFVEKIRKPLRNIKRETKIKIALVATALILMATGSAKYSNNQTEDGDKSYPTATEYQLDYNNQNNIDNKDSQLQDYNNENKINEYDAPTTKEEIEPDVSNIKEIQKENEDNKIKIGSTIKINEGAKIYQNSQDAYLEQNSFGPYYSKEDTRVILGVAVETTNGINYLYANDATANNKLDNLIANGGRVVSILTANKDRYLQDYNEQDVLHADEINAYAEGWYNINDIQLSNMKGKTL